jgi:hypothetical protein
MVEGIGAGAEDREELGARERGMEREREKREAEGSFLPYT